MTYQPSSWMTFDVSKQSVRLYLAHCRRLYGIAAEDIRAMDAAQDGACAICRKPWTRQPHVDHDHETGEVRGLLCSNCNSRLGWFELNAPHILTYLIPPEKENT